MNDDSCFFCNKREGDRIPIPEPDLFAATPLAVSHFECLQEAFKDLADRNS